MLSKEFEQFLRLFPLSSGADQISDPEEADGKELLSNDLFSREDFLDGEEDFFSDSFENLEGEKKMYSDCQITLNESMIMLMTLAQKFNFPQRAIKYILKFTRLHMPKKAKFYDSTYILRNIFSRKYKFTKVPYCKHCKKLLKYERGVFISCCAEKFNSKFLMLPLLDQIKCLFERKKFRELILNRSSTDKIVERNFESVCDGSVYKEHSEFLSVPTNFSLTLYADGVQLFNSSKSSTWPLCLVFNEIPYKERYKVENMLLLGCWYDGTQPDFNTWLSAAFEALKTLFHNGVQVTFRDDGNAQHSINVKGVIILVTADAPARAKIYKVNQYNGRFGCAVCYQSGSARKDAQNKTMKGPYVFPYEEIVNFRTSEQTIELGIRANALKTILYGIKGVSIMFKLIKDPIKSLALDPMHLIYSGVMCKFLEMLFGKKFNKEKFSLLNYLKTVDNYMICLKKPFFLNRSPRAIGAHLAYYTSAEHKYFFHYYAIPIFSQVMKKDGYLKHFFLLVEAVNLLNQDSISPADIDDAEEKLKKFVKDFEYLYGLNNMNYNIHSLLHLPHIVRRLGPLHVFSCFAFESANGIMKKMIKGTRYSEEIIAETFCTRQSLPLFVQNLPSSSMILDFLEEIKHTHQLKKIDKISNKVHALGGKYKLYTELGKVYTRNIRSAMFKSGMQISNLDKILCFHRIQIDKRIFTAKSQSLEPGGSHCVEYCENKIGLIETFLKIVKCACQTNTSCKCDSEIYVVINECKVQEIQGLHLNRFVNKLNVSDEYVIIGLHELKNLCVLINADDDWYYAKKINNVELE